MPYKAYAGVIGLVDSPSPDRCVAFCAHGHVPPADFCAWVRHSYDCEIAPESVRHILARWVPNRELGSVFQEAQTPGHGVFEATYAENLS